MAPGGGMRRGQGRGGGRGRGQGRGMGQGMGRGMGRGLGAGPGAPMPAPQQPFQSPQQQPSPTATPDQELERLKEQARLIEQQKAAIEQRIQQAEQGGPAGPVTLKAVVDKDLCTGCGLCLDACPLDAIVLVDGLANIGDNCTACGACVAECPNNAIAMGPA
jgi:ferredoxin